MAQLEKGNWPVVNVKAISNNVKLVFEKQDIRKLNGPTYKFIISHMGFIVHYDLQGFQDSYVDLRDFAQALQTSEYSQDALYNRQQAYRQETGADFRQWYGKAYQDSVAETMRLVVGIAASNQAEIGRVFGEKQKERELGTARALAAKYGYQLTT